MLNPVDEKGRDTSLEPTPFIWEVDNRDAFKEVGTSFEKLAKMQRLPVQHIITANTEERKIPTGASFYVPVVSLDVTNTIELTEEDQSLFGDFMSWVDNYNNYIINAWSEKANAHVDEDEQEIIDDIVDVELEDEVA
jgi:hypothetical protein